MQEELLRTYNLRQIAEIEGVCHKTAINRAKEGAYLLIEVGNIWKHNKMQPQYKYLHPKVGKLLMDAYKKGYFDIVKDK